MSGGRHRLSCFPSWDLITPSMPLGLSKWTPEPSLGPAGGPRPGPSAAYLSQKRWQVPQEKQTPQHLRSLPPFLCSSCLSPALNQGLEEELAHRLGLRGGVGITGSLQGVNPKTLLQGVLEGSGVLRRAGRCARPCGCP